MTTTVPMLSPVLPARPWWKTSQGSRPETGPDEHRQRNAVHGEADKELKEPAGHHVIHPRRKLALQSIASLKYWLYVRLPEPHFAGPPPGRVEPRRGPRVPGTRRRRPPPGAGRPRPPGRRPAQRARPGRHARHQPDHGHRRLLPAPRAGIPQQRPGQPRPDLHSRAAGPAAGGRTAAHWPARPGWPCPTGCSTWPTRPCPPAAKWCTGPSPPP